MVRVRFAPSPTGYLHIGGARTAIYNWLFARKMGGTFILRIEDTDEVRSTRESVDAILESLDWLGLDWDEGPEKKLSEWKSESKSTTAMDSGEVIVQSKGTRGPYSQMQRQDIYKKYINQLISENKAYYCYCTPEELDKMRREQMSMKQLPKYNGKCRSLSKDEREKLENEGRKPTVRFKMPEAGKTKVKDIIRGEIEFENSSLDDFIMFKGNSIPTYNFACVIDDHLMEITHIIRGDDHLSNTPKQIQLYHALGWQVPEFAHLSMILGSDKTKLSKRHGYASVLEYMRNGFLAEALFNYLVLLGWSTEDSQQIFSKNEVVEKFTLKRCAKNPAVFDTRKVTWMNGEYIRNKSIGDLYKTLLVWLDNTGQIDVKEEVTSKEEIAKKVIELEQDKIKLLSDIPGRIGYFLADDIEYNGDAVEKIIKKENVEKILKKILEIYEKIKNFDASEIENQTRKYTSESGFKTSGVFHPVRVAVSGKTQGPGLFEMLELLGKETVIKRIKYTLQNFLA